MKPVKAWAEFGPDGKFICACKLSVGSRRAGKYSGRTYVHVEIREVKSKRAKKALEKNG